MGLGVGCYTCSSFVVAKNDAKNNSIIDKTKNMKKCEQEGCNTCAGFGFVGEFTRFCTKHKLAGMVDKYHKRCEYECCDSINPIFGLIGGKRQFCVKHKTDEMVDISHKQCKQVGCTVKNPIFGIPGEKDYFCVTHKTSEMIDLKNKQCKFEGCDRRNPVFNIPGDKGQYCILHKTIEMIDTVSKRCAFIGCSTIPVFDISGGKGKFCKLHKTSNMINVRITKCEYIGCDITPSFNIPGGKGRFCVTHKTAEMVDVINKMCGVNNCLVRPTFDISGGIGRFCKIHKTAEMNNIKNKKCKSCNTSASYGRPGHMKSHCFKHREPGMIRKPNAKCSIPLCKELAIWGTNWIPKHCEDHKTADDTNLVEQPCSSCGLMYVLDTENKCENCNPESFATARLAKQNALMSYLDARGLEGDSTDTTVDGGVCGKERPDRVYDFGDKIVILECDENQHQDRQCLCEQSRMVNIGQTFGGVPVYFIRWNPDDYSPENDRKYPEELATRHKLVGNVIRDIKKGKVALPSALVSVLYMYYDGWNALADEEWTILTQKQQHS